MSVQIYSAIILISCIWKSIHAIENKVYYSHGKGTTFREELVITNVTSSDDFVQLGLRALKWKSITVNVNSYAVGLMTTGVCLVKPVRNDFSWSIQSNITDNTNKIKDFELYKVWNSTSATLEAIVVLLLEDGTLEWFAIAENLTLVSIWSLPLDEGVVNFKIYPIHSVDHLFILKRKPTGTTLEILKYNLFNFRHKSLWLQEPIHFDEEITSFTLNALASDYFLSIPHKSLNMVKIYKQVDHEFVHHSTIKESNADHVQSFSIGPNSYLLINGHNAGIYKMTKYGPIRVTINHNHFHGVDRWLIMPIRSFKHELFLLGQKELDHDGHKSIKLELIHSNGFDFNAYDEIPCDYYGSKLHGIDCVVEEDPYHIGINSSTIVPFHDFIGLIMPAEKQASRLFHLNTVLRKIPNPKKEKLMTLREKEQKLKAMQLELKKFREIEHKSSPIVQAPQATFRMNKSRKEYQQRSAGTEEVTEELQNVLEVIQKSLDNLQTELDNIPSDIRSFGTLIINAPLTVEGKSSISKLESITIDHKNTEDVLGDIVVRGEKKNITGDKTFTNLEVGNVIFDQINGKNKEELLYRDKPIEIEGSLTIENLIKIDGDVITEKVNGVILEDEIVQSGQVHTGPIEFENIDVTGNLEMASEPNLDYRTYFNTNVFENLTILSNLTVEKINSDNFTNIENQIVMKNIDSAIPAEVTIDGILTITSDAHIHFLNKLIFPDEYVLQSSENTEISGKKIFENDVSTKTLKNNGLINGVNTSNVVTLSDNQSISGVVHFTDLSVHEFNSTNIVGKDTEDFLQNLTLNETTHLKTPAMFQSLEVEGFILIDRINNDNISAYLDNIVFKDDENVTINSQKEFNTLSVSKVELDLLNSHPFNLFVNKEAEQQLNLETLNGNVTFKNLYLTGDFGDVNITNILTNSIKVDEDKNISLLCLSELTVDNIQILDKLNNLPVNDYLFTTGDRIMSSVKKMQDVNAGNVIVKDNLIADIEGLSPEDLKERILSTVEDQYIGETAYIGDLSVGTLEGAVINNRSFGEVFNSDFYASALASMISENKLKIKHLNIEGNLITNKVNELNMTDILKSCFFTTESNLQPVIAFRDHVNFNELTVDIFNGVPFTEFLENLVFKNETKLKLADKNFPYGFDVENFIDTEYLNGISLENILRDGNEKEIRGPLNIQGDVIIVGDVETETLNEVPVTDLKNKVKIDGNNVKINGDLWVEHLLYINNFWTYNFVNGEKLEDVLDNVVFLNESAVLKHKITFNEKVTFQEDFDVTIMNGIDIERANEDVVMINKDNTIYSPVTFQRPVEIKNQLTVTDKLKADSIMGVNISDWSDNAVFINKFVKGELKFGNVTIAHEVKTDFINNISMSRLVPLRTKQNISETLYIDKLSSFHNVTVDGMVNGLKLKPEYSNTVLKHGTQIISSKVHFEDNVMVYKEATIERTVNDEDFNNVIHLNKNQSMSAGYNFLSKVLTQNVTVNGLVNGINITQWQQASLRKNINTLQNVSQPVHVKNLLLENYSHGKGLISGLDFQNLSNVMEYKRKFKNRFEGELATDYGMVCNDVRNLLQIAKKQTYKFKHLDSINYLVFDTNIEMIYAFKYDDGDYVLIRKDGSNSTYLYSWNYKNLVEVDQIEMGRVVQIINVNTNDGSSFITRSNASFEGDIQGSNLWKFEDNSITLVHQLAEDLTLLQESQVVNTFYGLSKDYAYEYIIRQNRASVCRKWSISGDDLSFVPPGLNTGLALRDSKRLIKLSRALSNEESEYSHNTEEIIIGSVNEYQNNLNPGLHSGDFVVLNVGMPKTVMVAVISQEPTWVKGRTDSIKVYSDISLGLLFHKIPTYKPSSLVSLEFGNNGETLLIFLEDQRVLQIYEYKGIEGFRHRRSVKFEGEAIIKFKIPVGAYNKNQDVLAIVHKNEVTFLEVIMVGESVDIRDLNCKI